MGKTVKTNAMRRLDAEGIPYRVIAYEVEDGQFDGEEAARRCGLDPKMVFKTLVLRGEKAGPLVCAVPVERELDLKALAQAAGEKRVELIHVKELAPLTGYLRGGCSPVGMKKLFPTYFDASCLALTQIAVSAGVRGCEMVLSPKDLIRLTGGKTACLAR